ncbi:unnamed protein product [Echinostoma caproni]|uniref:LINES_N domain-containing protein n=1 Tax=Echinostoma caproni TaxID=27848 RepID=A0A183AUQ1_9TREM|nr:unnamed protein product [Echinostoma caproni]
MSDRNPSPPAELGEELQHVDQIGDTAYSKCWLYALLMKVLNLVKSNTTTDVDEIRELDQELEEQLCHLLIATIRLLDAITREDDSLAEVWCGSALLNAILVAQRQMKWLHGSEVEVIHRVLYTFSSNVSGVSALIHSFDQLLPTFGVYLRKVCEDEPHLIPFSAYYNSLRAIIPIIDAVAASLSPAQSVACCSVDTTVLPSLVHITLGCQCQLDEFPLGRGILADLSILFKDLVRSIRDALKNLTSSSDDLHTAIDLFEHDLGWLRELDTSTDDDHDRVERLRRAFILCCLNDNDNETRGQLVYICNRLKLSRLLEEVTDDD